jgi:hypothetical protein
VNWLALLVAAAVAGLLAAALVALATRQAFRGAVPERYGEAT